MIPLGVYVPRGPVGVRPQNYINEPRRTRVHLIVDATQILCESCLIDPNGGNKFNGSMQSAGIQPIACQQMVKPTYQ